MERDLQKDFSSLLNLQIITEKLLFQLEQLPAEIADKFHVLKRGTYEAIGLTLDNPFGSIEQIFKDHHHFQSQKQHAVPTRQSELQTLDFNNVDWHKAQVRCAEQEGAERD